MRDRLYISQEKEEAFRTIGTISPFKELNLSAKSIFIIAAIFGSKNRVRKELKKRKEYVRMEYLTQEDRSLLKALAVKEKRTLDVLLNPEEIFVISEELASCGIDFLKSLVSSLEDASVEKRLERLLLEEFQKNQS